MNNWRLLLLAVIAVLQPIGSFTERNLIDGHQECCDHGPNSVTRDTRLYGNYRKSTPEERVSSRQDTGIDRRYESRHDAIRRSTERLDRTARGLSESVGRRSIDNRFARDEDRRHRVVIQGRETQIREDRRVRERSARVFLSQYERDVLDSKRTRMSRDDTRRERDGIDRLRRDSARSAVTRNEMNSEERRLMSPNTLIFNRERAFVVHARRNMAENSFRSESRLQMNTNRQYRSDGRRMDNTRDGRLTRSLERLTEREDVMSRRDLRDDRRNNFRDSSERLDERKHREQNRASIFVDTTRRFRESTNRQPQYRDAIERLDQTRRDVRKYHSERVADRRQERDESRRYRDRDSQVHVVALREMNSNARPDVEMRGNDRLDAPREVTRDISRASRVVVERRADSRVTRMVEANTRGERFVRSERVERRQSLRTEIPLERYSRISSQSVDRNSREERLERNHRAIRSVERLNEPRQRESRMSTDRSTSILRESIRAERRSENRIFGVTRFEVRSDRAELRAREDFRDNLLVANRRQQEERRVTREQVLSRLARDTRRYETRISRDTERISRVERSRTAEDIADNERREVRSDERRSMRSRSATRVTRERTEDERRDVRETTRASRVGVRNELTRGRDNVRISERIEFRLVDDRRPSNRLPLQRQSRDSLARSVERRTLDTSSRDAERNVRSEKSVNRASRGISERNILNNRDFRIVESRRESRTIARDNRGNSALERTEKISIRVNRDVPIPVTLRASARDLRTENRDIKRTAFESRFRSFEAAKTRGIESVELTSENSSIMNWQIVFYTLQGAYLCGLLMQMLVEKPNKGKSRNLSWWSSKNLVKVD